MRTFISTLVLVTSIAAGPALAQQHPWVPSGSPTGSLPNGDLPAVQHPWVPSAYAGTVPNGAVARADSGSAHRARHPGK